ncbi:extracellular solute-binding protein [Henriciella barbarensis]|nr:extracellular solute-binding protein [Henriciella barbarensis]
MKTTMKTIASVSFTALLVACSDGGTAPTASDDGMQSDATEESGDTAENIEAGSDGTLNIYSARHYDSDKLMYEAFEDQTGIRVRFREAGANQLLETMRAEGENSPADLIIASDAGALWRFKDAGLTQPLPEGEFEQLIPERLIEPGRQWVGLARRIRGVAYDPERISPVQVDEWQDLADPSLEGEICVRSSTNIYNLSLMAEMIEKWGAEEAQSWADAVVANMARTPQGGDTDQVEAVAAGLCSVAITNHYYWVRMTQSGSNATREAAAATQIAFPSFGEGEGIHVNITGVAMAANAQNRDEAMQFVDYLLSADGQHRLVDETKEIPVIEDVTWPQGLDAIPEFEDSDTPLDTFGERQSEAQRIYDEAGWN